MTVLRVIDFETNGLAPPAEVIELGRCDLTGSSDGEWTVGMPSAELFSISAPMDPGARATHHIQPAEIENEPPYIASANIARGADALVAHNWAFEGQWLTPEILGAGVRVICTYKAALRVWPEAPSHSNGALRYWLEDQGLITPAWSLTQPPHRAGPDAYVTAWLLKALLTKATGREMIQWTKEPRLLTTCPIGKQKGEPWAQVDAGFLGWCLRQPTMEEDIKWNVRRELERRTSQ